MMLGVFYAVLFYLASAIFVIGIVYKIQSYASSPAPLKIPTMPAPMTKSGVAMRMFREVAFFESLFRSNKWTWIFGWAFHMSLVLIFFRHLRYFMDPLPFWVVWAQPFGQYAAFLMLFGLAGLFGRRIFVERVRYISSPSDYLMLVLLFVIGGSGAIMSFTMIGHTDIVAVKYYIQNLLGFSIVDIPSDFFLLVHLILVIFLMAIFPISKLLHAPGFFFSPTRNQVDDSRSKRHLAPWAAKLEKN